MRARGSKDRCAAVLRALQRSDQIPSNGGQQNVDAGAAPD